MRRISLALVLLTAACGSSPATPSLHAPASLSAGFYTLLVYSAHNTCFSSTVSSGPGRTSPAPAATIRLHLSLAPVSDGWSGVLVAPTTGSARLTAAQPTAGSVRLELTGGASDGTAMVSFQNVLNGSATGQGREFSGGFSDVGATITFTSIDATASTTCADPVWTLSPE